MDEARSVTLKLILDTGLKELYGLWDEIGFDTITQRDRNETVKSHFKMMLEQGPLFMRGRVQKSECPKWGFPKNLDHFFIGT